VRLAGLLDDSFQGVLRFRGFEEGETAVTAEGDEVELACILSPLEAYGHGLDFSRWEGGRFELRSNAHSCRDKTGHEWGTRLWLGLDVWATRPVCGRMIPPAEDCK
jgi:hypothetical protein